jgi:hypothetical protein
MIVYPWPGFPVSHFEMRIVPNQRIFTGPYTPTTQAIDLLGERWTITLTMTPTNDPISAARREAFFDLLQGSVNAVSMGHQKLTLPQGTMRGQVTQTWKNSSGATMTWKNASAATMTWSSGAPVVAADIAQGASTAQIRAVSGETLLAGDMIALGTQLVRNLVDVTFDSTGLATITFGPRARTLIPAGSAVLWTAPTANFILKPSSSGTAGVPTPWTPGIIEGGSTELIEVF